MKHGLDQLSGSFSRGVESLKKSAALQSRGGSTSVYCKGVRQLDNYGYEKFNLEDGGDEIFISRHSEKSMFNEDDSILVRATDGNFVAQPDTSKEVPAVESPVVAPVDARTFFGNVPVPETTTEIHGIVGTVDDGKVVPVPVDNGFLSKMVKPAPGMQKLDTDKPEFEAVLIPDVPVVSAEPPVEEVPADNSFLSRMIKVTPVAKEDEEPEIMEVPDEPETVEAVEETPEVPATETIEVAEAPVEEVPVAPVEEPEVTVAPVVIPVVCGEFFVGTDDDDCETSGEESAEDVPADSSLDDDYNIMFPAENEEIVEAPVEEVPATETIEEPETVETIEVAEAPVEEVPVAPVEEPEVTVAPVVIPLALVEEVPVAPVEEPEVAEIPAEVPEAVEAPAEESIVVEPKIGQTIEVPEMPEGLYIEGNEPGNVAVASAGDAVQTAEATVTGSTATEPSSGIRVGLDADGEALPPISDPVVTRPRSVRFRFANGVLMSVDSKTEGSQEEPARPLE